MAFTYCAKLSQVLTEMLIILSNSNTCGPTKSNTKYCGKMGQQIRIIPGQVASTVSCMVQHFVLLHRALGWVGSGNKAKLLLCPWLVSATTQTCFLLHSLHGCTRLASQMPMNISLLQKVLSKGTGGTRKPKGSGGFGGCFGVICHQLEQIYVRERLKPWNSRKGSGGVGDKGWCAV